MLHPGSATKSAVRRLRIDGRPAILKDCRALHPLLRALYGRRCLRREARALERLGGVAGAPLLLARPDADSLLMEWRPGEPWVGRVARAEPERFRRALVDLEGKVAELHRTGVAHLDLRQRRNLLVDAEGRVSLIDFESAVDFGSSALRRFAFGWMAALDRAAVLKFKGKFAPELLSEDERRRYARQQRYARWWFFHRIGAWLGIRRRRGEERRIRNRGNDGA